MEDRAVDLRPFLTDWLPLVQASAARTQAAIASGGADPELVTAVADLLAIFAYELRPRPAEPLAYLHEARDEVNARLRRLGQADPTLLTHIRSEDGFDFNLT